MYEKEYPTEAYEFLRKFPIRSYIDEILTDRFEVIDLTITPTPSSFQRLEFYQTNRMSDGNHVYVVGKKEFSKYDIVKQLLKYALKTDYGFEMRVIIEAENDGRGYVLAIEPYRL